MENINYIGNKNDIKSESDDSLESMLNLKI